MLQDSAANQNEKAQSTDKDDYVYDEVLLNDNAPQTDNVEATQKTAKVESEKPEATAQNNDDVTSTKQEFNPISEPLQTNDTNVDMDNNIANALNANMSLESKMEFVRMQEEQLREHMSITLEELGMNDTVDVLRIREPDEVIPSSVVPNRK